MKLSEVKTALGDLENIVFKLEDGSFVPEHFHVTEVGIVTKHFIDCGGQVRNEKVANFQLWDANDHEHRLKPGKLRNIISLSERILGMPDLEVEVEYQSETIGRYDLDFDGSDFVLRSKKTACLAEENCGVSDNGSVDKIQSCCAPDGNCC
ncbi:DUF6428 family protein [Flavobacterium selenitireducens]|uniref:DUF6428 family protein n=1 Tax=Flavobacterium selenitireducens TaxID=2722704 RepID=UPI00168B8941|nr:DUF6428 family protein [Flavobacterium selenitireducens]MBD3582278.1 hypothetical protein [Flavobacterium selenitireducens]